MGPRSSGARAGRASDNCPILLPRTRRDCRCANWMCRFFFEGRGSAVEFPECDQPAPRRLQINYLTILYMVTPSPLGQTPCLTGTTNLVVTGTTTAPHASDRVAKKAPLQINPLQTPAPSSRENEMRTMVGRGGRQDSHRRRQSQHNRCCKSFHVRTPLSSHEHVEIPLPEHNCLNKILGG